MKNRDHKWMLVMEIVDILGKKCTLCNKGTYQEIDNLHSDKVRCTNCGNISNRNRKQVK